MALLFVDGMTHYATDDISKKYDDKYSNWVYYAISTTEQRRAASKSLRINEGYLFYIQKNVVSSDDTVIFGFAYYQEKIFGVCHGWMISNAIGNQITFIPKSDGSIEVRRGNGVGTLLDTSAAAVISPKIWNYIEVKVKISDAAGTYDIVVNGVNVLSGAGADTQGQAAATFNKIALYGNGGGYAYYTDFYVCDSTGTANNDFLGDIRVDTLYPDGAGNYTQWDANVGANYECVDDDGDIDDDTTYVSTDTLSELDSYTYDNLSASGATIHGVTSTWCTRKDDAGAVGATPITRVAASDYLGSEITLTDDYVTEQYIWDVNPDDAAAWAEADVNGMELGVKLTTT